MFAHQLMNLLWYSTLNIYCNAPGFGQERKNISAVNSKFRIFQIVDQKCLSFTSVPKQVGKRNETGISTNSFTLVASSWDHWRGQAQHKSPNLDVFLVVGVQLMQVQYPLQHLVLQDYPILNLKGGKNTWVHTAAVAWTPTVTPAKTTTGTCYTFTCAPKEGGIPGFSGEHILKLGGGRRWLCRWPQSPLKPFTKVFCTPI